MKNIDINAVLIGPETNTDLALNFRHAPGQIRVSAEELQTVLDSADYESGADLVITTSLFSPAVRQFASGLCLLDCEARAFYVNGKPIELRYREFSVLACLTRHLDEEVTSEEITDFTWGEISDSRDPFASLLSTMARLRKNLSRAHPDLGDKKNGVIKTMLPNHRTGYRAKYSLRSEWPSHRLSTEN